jgi:hypothetical protein
MAPSVKPGIMGSLRNYRVLINEVTAIDNQSLPWSQAAKFAKVE